MIVCKLMKDNVLLTSSHSFSTSLMDPQDKANNVPSVYYRIMGAVWILYTDGFKFAGLCCI